MNDSEMNDSVTNGPPAGPAGMTAEQRAQRLAEAKERSLRGLRATGTSDIKTPADLRARLMEYITYMEEDVRFARLYGMNRRFGYVATQLGTTVRTVLEEMVRDGELISHQQASSRFFVTPDSYLILTEFNPPHVAFEAILKDTKANDY